MVRKQAHGISLYEINQSQYIMNLSEIPMKSDFNQYHSSIAKVSWVCHSTACPKKGRKQKAHGSIDGHLNKT